MASDDTVHYGPPPEEKDGGGPFSMPRHVLQERGIIVQPGRGTRETNPFLPLDDIAKLHTDHHAKLKAAPGCIAIFMRTFGWGLLTRIEHSFYSLREASRQMELGVPVYAAVDLLSRYFHVAGPRVVQCEWGRFFGFAGFAPTGALLVVWSAGSSSVLEVRAYSHESQRSLEHEADAFVTEIESQLGRGGKADSLWISPNIGKKKPGL